MMPLLCERALAKQLIENDQVFGFDVFDVAIREDHRLGRV
jgi:hypothetical protein